MKIGDKVVVRNGDWNNEYTLNRVGLVGTIVGTGGEYNWVVQDEAGRDVGAFYEKELELIEAPAPEFTRAEWKLVCKALLDGSFSAPNDSEIEDAFGTLWERVVDYLDNTKEDN